MKRLFKLYSYAGKYWPLAILTPIMMVGEAILELQIPGKIADLINYLDSQSASGTIDMRYLITLALWLVFFSLMSLLCGTLGAIFGARASAGFAANLKKAMYEKIQTFSFANIDK